MNKKDPIQELVMIEIDNRIKAIGALPKNSQREEDIFNSIKSIFEAIRPLPPGKISYIFASILSIMLWRPEELDTLKVHIDKIFTENRRMHEASVKDEYPQKVH